MSDDVTPETTAAPTAAFHYDPVPDVARVLGLAPGAVGAVVAMLDEGNTVPFVARYRKERTGGLDEVQIRAIEEQRTYLVELETRRAAILASVAEQGKLTPELEAKLRAAVGKAELEDLYAPYRPRRKTRASVARDKGLEPLARKILAQGAEGDPAADAAGFVGEQVASADDALAGARDIAAEVIADTAEIRAFVRREYAEHGELSSTVVPNKGDEPTKFEQYYQFKEAVKTIPSHRFLAIRRGEAEGVLRAHVAVDPARVEPGILRLAKLDEGSPWAALLRQAAADALKRLLAPSVENDVRAELKQRSDGAAVDIFAGNLRNLMLAAPLGSAAVIGVDPGLRTGCKCAAIDATGKFLGTVTVYISQGDAQLAKAKDEFIAFVQKFTPRAIAVGNGTGGREAESFVKRALADMGRRGGEPATEAGEAGHPAQAVQAVPAVQAGASDDAAQAGASGEAATGDAAQAGASGEAATGDAAQAHASGEAATDAAAQVGASSEAAAGEAIAVGEPHAPRNAPFVVQVNEAGASVYSASDLAREEFPELDLTIRGAISIARRLQDPLAELVKIEPKSIGVGQYQHDVHQPMLAKKLGDVVEDCVNHVGVELNTASAQLLSYVAGVGKSLAKKIVVYRDAHGAFTTRAQLLEVSSLGPKAFEQAAGFLRIANAAYPLDQSAVHPERYPLIEQMAKDLGVELPALLGNQELVDKIDFAKYVSDEVGEPTLRDIAAELKKPGRDPRAEFSPPKFRDDVTSMDDLKVGMVLEGIVTNVTAFGAFVDIGVHNDGLVHVSQLSDQFVKDPSEVVKVGQKLMVRVIEIDNQRKRIALSAKRGGQQQQQRQPRRDDGGGGNHDGGQRPPRNRNRGGGGGGGQRAPYGEQGNGQGQRAQGQQGQGYQGQGPQGQGHQGQGEQGQGQRGQGQRGQGQRGQGQRGQGYQGQGGQGQGYQGQGGQGQGGQGQGGQGQGGQGHQGQGHQGQGYQGQGGQGHQGQGHQGQGYQGQGQGHQGQGHQGQGHQGQGYQGHQGQGHQGQGHQGQGHQGQGHQGQGHQGQDPQGQGGPQGQDQQGQGGYQGHGGPQGQGGQGPQGQGRPRRDDRRGPPQGGRETRQWSDRAQQGGPQQGGPQQDGSQQGSPLQSDQAPSGEQRADRGPQGDRGPRRDDRGPYNDRGPRRDGPQGPQGDRGPRRDDRGPYNGPPGDRGPQGDRGPRRDDRGPYNGPPGGDRGPQGDRGPRRDDRGPQGAGGPPGDRGPRRDDRGPQDASWGVAGFTNNPFAKLQGKGNKGRS